MNKNRFFLTTVLALTVLCQLPAMARCHHFDHIYNKYRDDDAVTTFNLSPWMVRMAVGDEDEDLKRVLKRIDEMKIIAFEETKGRSGNFAKEVHSWLADEQFQDLMVIRDGTDNIEIKMISENKRIKELVVFITDSDSALVLYLSGDIDVQQALKISKHVHVTGIS